MLKKIKNIVYLLSFCIFILLIANFYFSDYNIKKINKSRSFYLNQSSHSSKNIPLLKNDTKDVVEYKNDIEIYKKRKKNYIFWNLIEK